MVKIRLSRLGSKGTVFYRIVAINEQSKRSGKFLEILGYWYPSKGTKELKKDRIKFWQDKGAIPSAAVSKLFK